jgi:hypothetical protein
MSCTFIALDLIAHGQISHTVTSQAVAIEMASGVFGGGEVGCPIESFACGRTLAGRGLVVAGGCDEVHVASEKIEVVQALVSAERIGQGAAHVNLDQRENLTEQGKPPGAFKALKKR